MVGSKPDVLCVAATHCGSPVWPDFLPPPGWVTSPSTSAHLCYQNRSPRRFPYYQSPQSLHCLNRLPQVSQKFWGKPIMRRILSQGGSPPLPPSQPKQVTHTSLITNHTKRITEQQYHNIFTQDGNISISQPLFQPGLQRHSSAKQILLFIWKQHWLWETANELAA